MFRLFRSKIYVAIGLLAFTLTFGILGYRIVASYSWIDAVYMTVITLSTVGFGEVAPLTPEAKIFTIFLILSSVIIVGYAISVITEYILSQNNYETLKNKRVQKKIEILSGHIIVCGFGRNGRQAVEKLKAYKRPYVIIEHSREIIERYQNEETLFVEGNANEDETLMAASIEQAHTLITALPDDADNLFVVLSARQLNQKLKIISRAEAETSQKKLKLAGANNVIMPNRRGGDHMASLVVHPDLIEFLDNLAVVGDGDSINVEEISFEQISNDGKEITLREVDLRQKTGCTVIGYKSSDNKYTVNPSVNQVIGAGSKLIVIGRPEQIVKLHNIFGNYNEVF